MGYSVLRCFEYVMECDTCGAMEILHTGDFPTVDGKSIYVHNRNTAIKGALYHQSKGKLLCDECFAELKGENNG